MLVRIFRLLFALCLIIVILYVANNFNHLIRGNLNHILPIKVLGANDYDPTVEIKQDLTKQLESLKAQAMNIRVSDVLSTLGRVEQIAKDARETVSFAKDQFQHLINHKPN